MSSEQSIFTFDLNETLYFERGQELEELRGISLDPEISIQALDDYISIRGVIELKGNYVKSGIEEDNREELSDYSELKRYIENVVETNETEAEFTHRFPVEISVPTYRVTDLDDVTVSVDSFDYELPNTTQLKLYSTIAIHGINQEVVREEEVIDEEIETGDSSSIEDETAIEQEEERIETSTTLETEEEESFEFDIKHQQEEFNQEAEVSNDIETPTLSERFETEEKVDVEEEETEEETNEENKEDGRWTFKTESQSLSEFFAKKDTTAEEEEAEEIVSEYVAQEDVTGEDVQTEIVYENTSDSRDEKDITYLSDIFRNTEEEEFTKMRLCIVQKEDTIETISERFQVSPLQVIKQNQLEEDFDVSEGQLLYIPVNK